MKRFPQSVYGVGVNPDPRFTLANERTFLAWIRTGLGMIAAGVALEAFAVDLQPQLRLAASVLLVVAGIAAPAQAWTGWMRAERAMRLAEPLPAPRLALPVAAVVIVAAILALVAILVSK